MSIGALDAASAYGRVLGNASAGRSSTGSAGVGQLDNGGFGGLVEQMVTSASQAMHTAEKASVQQVAGKGDLIDVVTAIGAAENALETMVAVRDKVVGAYTEIMRMQI
jgi:flagellar hook-basal body complex protein FliE